MNPLQANLDQALYVGKGRQLPDYPPPKQTRRYNKETKLNDENQSLKETKNRNSQLKDLKATNLIFELYTGFRNYETFRSIL